jgi:hypothetical protein
MKRMLPFRRGKYCRKANGRFGVDSKAAYLVEREVSELRGFGFNSSWKIMEEDRTGRMKGRYFDCTSNKVRLRALTCSVSRLVCFVNSVGSSARLRTTSLTPPRVFFSSFPPSNFTNFQHHPNSTTRKAGTLSNTCSVIERRAEVQIHSFEVSTRQCDVLA